MRRFLASALILGIFALPAVLLVGCGETASSTSTTEIKTPSGGSDKIETTSKETVK